MMGLIGAIIALLGIPIGIWLTIKDIQRWNRLIKMAGKKELVFVNEESKMRCSYCGREISKEEYETERYGYCDECSDDLATEEETQDVWKI